MSVCPFVRPSVGMEQLSSRWTDFHKILYFTIFLKTVKKIQVSLKSYKNSGYFTLSPRCIFMAIFGPVLLRMRNVSNKGYTENQNTHFVSSNFFLKSCRLSDNVETCSTVGQATDDNMAGALCTLEN
jgi:hypothetical protein